MSLTTDTGNSANNIEYGRMQRLALAGKQNFGSSVKRVCA
jgi:hypothetical protein